MKYTLYVVVERGEYWCLDPIEEALQDRGWFIVAVNEGDIETFTAINETLRRRWSKVAISADSDPDAVYYLLSVIEAPALGALEGPSADRTRLRVSFSPSTRSIIELEFRSAPSSSA